MLETFGFWLGLSLASPEQVTEDALMRAKKRKELLETILQAKQTNGMATGAKRCHASRTPSTASTTTTPTCKTPISKCHKALEKPAVTPTKLFGESGSLDCCQETHACSVQVLHVYVSLRLQICIFKYTYYFDCWRLKV